MSPPMKPTAMEEARDERNALLAHYRRAKKKEMEDLLQGPHGIEVKALATFLKSMTTDNAGELIEFVMSSAWIKRMEPETKFSVLSMIGSAIIKLRERNGMASFDDPIENNDTNAFLILRKAITGV